MKKTIILVHLLLMFLIATFLSGCQFSGFGGGTSREIYVGTDALSMDFLENAPPDEAYEDSQILILVNLRNQGAYDIENGKIAVGVETDYVQLAGESVHDLNIEGRSLDNYIGGYDTFKLPAQVKKLDNQSESRTLTVYVTSCYAYQTRASADVCIDTDIYNLKPGQKSCFVQDVDLSGGQGAPVAVTSVQVEMVPNFDDKIVTPTFIIQVENQGNGEVLNKSKIDEACSQQGLGYQTFNILEMKAFLAETPLTCTPTPLKLKEGTDYVLCKLEGGIPTNMYYVAKSYMSPLTIELSYGYTFTISKDIEIKKGAI